MLTYVGPGGYIGEIGLLSDIPEVAALGAPAGLRVATCAALDHVDLVKISGTAFQDILAKFPEVRERLIGVAMRRLEENEANRRKAKAMPVGEFVKQGLMNAQSLLVLDLEKCTRCDECTKACSDAHSDVTRLLREGLRFENWLVASSCRSCLDPYCMVGCPVDSIHRKSSREMVIEDWCIGCGNCARTARTATSTCTASTWISTTRTVRGRRQRWCSRRRPCATCAPAWTASRVASTPVRTMPPTATAARSSAASSRRGAAGA